MSLRLTRMEGVGHTQRHRTFLCYGVGFLPKLPWLLM